MSHKKIWRTGEVQKHVDPHHIPLNESNNNAKLDKDIFKIKFRRDPMSCPKNWTLVSLKWSCLKTES